MHGPTYPITLADFPAEDNDGLNYTSEDEQGDESDNSVDHVEDDNLPAPALVNTCPHLHCAGCQHLVAMGVSSCYFKRLSYTAAVDAPTCAI